MQTAYHGGHSQRADSLEEELAVEVTVNQTRHGEYLSSRYGGSAGVSVKRTAYFLPRW